MSIAIVTDSTASLPPEDVTAHGLVVVPLHVVIDGEDHVEADGAAGISPAEVGAALRSRREVSTSRPTPATFLDAYERAAAGGAEQIISVHLSEQLSGTVSSAQSAAPDSPVPVHVVDSEVIGMALGFAVLGAAADVRAGRPVEEVLERLRRRAAASSVRMYVDTLEHLRRGGRIGGAQALLGSALAIKPILEMRDGVVEPLERVRTRGRALSRLRELVEESLADLPDWADGAALAVQHVDARERADVLAEDLQPQVDEEVRIVETSAAIGAHVGPGTVGVVVSPRPRSAESAQRVTDDAR